MAKYYGSIGYVTQDESTPGVYKSVVKERAVYGEVFRNSKRPETNENLHGGISISNRISFIADPYALQNFHTIKYATYMGSKWNVVSVDVEYPRLVITLGGVYND